MLLRRFTAHMRSENWFAVVLDFLVVVVGIFVGLQVDDWNQDRKEQVLEQQYLERLLTDAEHSILLQQVNIDWLDKVIAANDVALRAFQTGTLAADRLQDFHHGIRLIAALPPLEHDNTTLTELQNSGGLSGIRNLELRNLLTRLITETNEMELQVVFFRNRIVAIFADVREHWRTDFDLDQAADEQHELTRPLYRFEDLSGNTALWSLVALAAENKRIIRIWFQDYQNQTNELRDALRDELGLAPVN